MSQSQWEKEFLNLVAYTEMKRQGLMDKQILRRFKIREHSLYQFKQQHGLAKKKQAKQHV